jgi:hypothetical protein
VNDSEVESGRRHRRRKTLLRGLVVSRDGSFVVEVLIRDLSESGAKIVVPGGQAIPKRCYLVISGRKCALEVIVVRTLLKEIGVRFAEMHTLGTLRGAEWQFLRRLIVERLPRSSALT